MTFSSKLFTAILLTSFSFNSYAYTLEESFKFALENYKNRELGQARIDQSEELKNQYEGAYLPKVALQGAYSKQDTFEDQKTIGLNLKTNLYNGGKDSLLVETADLSVSQAKNLEEFERINLFTRVVDAYYNYILAYNDLKNIELLVKQSKDRVDELNKRLDIGRSRRGEVLQAQAQLSSIEASRKNAEGLLKQYEAAYEKLINKKVNQVVKYNLSLPSTSKTLKEFVELALKREDIKNKELELKKSQTNYQITKRHFAPSVDLNSNVYAYKEGGSVTSRNSDWDVSLNVTIPLFEGGISNAKKNTQLAQVNVDTITLDNLKNDVVIETNRKYEQYQRYLDQVKVYKAAYDIAKNSYDENLKDYRLGLITNLEVLTSMNLYLDSKKEYEKSIILTKHNLKLLEAQAGIIPGGK